MSDGERSSGPQAWEPTGADVRAFSNAYGYSLAESRAFLLRNGPDARTSGGPT